MTVYYEEAVKLFEDCIEALAYAHAPTADQKCPHCGLVVRHPLIQRETDREDFAQLMVSAREVLDRNGITFALFAEVLARCHIANAAKGNE